MTIDELLREAYATQGDQTGLDPTYDLIKRLADALRVERGRSGRLVATLRLCAQDLEKECYVICASRIRLVLDLTESENT